VTFSATPLVFAFVPVSQFILVGSLTGALTPEQVDAVTKSAASLDSGAPSAVMFGLATRIRGLELCLVGVPVDQKEAATNRCGLTVVVGFCTSAAARVGPQMYGEAIQDVLLPALYALSPHDAATGFPRWAETLTRSAQGAGSSVGELVTGCGEVAEDIGRMYTVIVNGYRKRKYVDPPGQGRADDILAQLIDAQMTALYTTAVGHQTYVVPTRGFADLPDITQRLAAHAVVGDQVLVCVEAPGDRRPRWPGRS
jgi:hypothetical protein